MFFVYTVWVFEYVLVVLGKTHLARVTTDVVYNMHTEYPFIIIYTILLFVNKCFE